MAAKSWQYIGAGVAVPLLGWALTDILKGNTWIAYVAFPFAIGLGAVCLIGILVARHRAVTMRDGLSAFLASGEELKRQVRQEGQPVPKEAVDSWHDRIEAFLRKHASEAHVTRLNFDTPNSLMPIGNLTQEQRNYWSWINDRCIRLEEFLREAALTA